MIKNYLLHLAVLLFSLPALGQGYIPEEVHTPDLPQITMDTSFEDPFEGIVTPSPYQKSQVTNLTESQDEFQKKWKDLGSTPASPTAQAAPTYFDYSKVNSERFINSPCYKELGFDPNGSLTEQEEKYKNCEGGKSGQNFSKGNWITFLGVSFFIVLFAILAYVSNRGTGETEIPCTSTEQLEKKNLKIPEPRKDTVNDKGFAPQIIKDLTELKNLRDSSIITEEEFQLLKKELLNCTH